MVTPSSFKYLVALVVSLVAVVLMLVAPDPADLSEPAATVQHALRR